MAKQIKTEVFEIPVEEQPLIPQIDPQLEDDKQLIIKLRRVTKPIQSEIDEIYYLYKKYVDLNAPMYCANCHGGPMNSIQRYYWKVSALDIENLKTN